MIFRIIKIAAVFLSAMSLFGAGAYFVLTLMVQSEDTVVVPDLVGKEVVYTLELLTDLGLNTKVRGSEFSEGFPKNHVIHQEPEPGSEIKKDRDVDIILSRGAQSVMMPNLQGLLLSRAEIILEQNGLCRGELSTAHSGTISKDAIIAQAPAPGYAIERGGCVELIVSLGTRPNAYAMLDLSGLALDDAILLIERSRLVLGEIQFRSLDNQPKDVIVSQDPPAGFHVTEGDPVNLVLNRKSGAKAGRSLQPATGVALFRYRLKAGFLRRHIKVRVNSYGLSSDLIDAFMRPGEEIWLLIPKNRTSTVFLYEDDQLIQTRVFDE